MLMMMFARPGGMPIISARSSAVGKHSWINRSTPPSHARTSGQLGPLSPEKTIDRPVPVTSSLHERWLADRADERHETFDALARLMRNLLIHSPAGLDTPVDEVFLWVTFLPSRDRKAFVDELPRTLVAALTIENYAPVGQLLREWRLKAELHATRAWRADSIVRSPPTETCFRRLRAEGACRTPRSEWRHRGRRVAGTSGSRRAMRSRAASRFARPRRPTHVRRGIGSQLTQASETPTSTR